MGEPDSVAPVRPAPAEPHSMVGPSPVYDGVELEPEAPPVSLRRLAPGPHPPRGKLAFYHPFSLGARRRLAQAGEDIAAQEAQAAVARAEQAKVWICVAIGGYYFSDWYTGTVTDG